jgi:two-component sensor histidine kinase
MKENDLAEHHRAFESARDAMRESVDRIAAMASKTDTELASQRGLSEHQNTA